MARAIFPPDITIKHGRFSYTVKHRGHPTALWPYSIIRHDGQQITAPNGLGFQTQLMAVAAALLISSNRMPIYVYPPNQRHCAGWKDTSRGVEFLKRHLPEAQEWLKQYRKDQK